MTSPEERAEYLRWWREKLGNEQLTLSLESDVMSGGMIGEIMRVHERARGRGIEVIETRENIL